MFNLFPQLPTDIRREIWLASLGPMTLTFTKDSPPLNEKPDLFNSNPTSYSPEKDSYVGTVSLSDGSCKLFFVVKPSAAYLACKESRAFLRFVFAEPAKPDGGLPSWLDLSIDTIRFPRPLRRQLSCHPWFKQAQHLWVRIRYEALDYLHYDHRWIEDNLTSLKDITFEMRCVPGEGEWVKEWFPVFEEWFNHARWDPVSFSARVICYEEDKPEQEWLTPQNYLVVEKRVMSNHYQRVYKVPNWIEKIQWVRTQCIVSATDEELENPGEFLKKHQHFGA